MVRNRICVDFGAIFSVGCKRAPISHDAGFCFPSVPKLAIKCSVGERSVQRILALLTGDGYVSVEQRFRNDRAQTSNGYKLALDDPPSNCHRPPDVSDTGR
jgi:hypothetical protein